MLLAAGIAFRQGWRLHSGRYALLAYGLGLLALALGVWHLSRRPAPPRR